ncbi:MAG: hypothetical protein WC565_02590 [Parcubacteria group bacterium]
MIKKISIIGGGEIGKAISFIASGANIAFAVWDKDPSKSSVSFPGRALENAEVIFFCVPTSAVRSVLSELSPNIPSNVPLVFVSKGLEEKTGFTAPEIAAEFANEERIVFMGGPMLAEEILAGKGGHAVLGGHKETVDFVSQIFRGDNISVETAKDAYSIAVLGVLKNIYAMALGAAEGLGYDENVKSYLFSKAVSEMDAAAKTLRGKVGATNTAGIGDLMATSISPASSNRKTGFSFATGKTPERQSEGMISVTALSERLLKNLPNGELPEIFSLVLKMVENKTVDKSDWDRILSNQPK